MRLLLDSAHPRNATYTNEAGQVLYKVDKPYTFDECGTATIRKAVGTVNGVWQGDMSSNIDARGNSPFPDSTHEWSEAGEKDGDRHSIDKPFAGSDDEGGGGPSTREQPTLEGHFAFYGQVEFHSWHSSRFRYNGLDVSVSDFFRKEGWASYGRDRIFTASDGKEYRWHLGGGCTEMLRNDDSKTRVVKFKEFRQKIGPFNGRPASLEIDDSCAPILDEIILTFIYCEKLKNDRTYYATRRNSAAGAMGVKY